MPSESAILAVVQRYASVFSAKDREGWLALFSDDVQVTEPADAPVRRGKDVFAQVFDSVYSSDGSVALTPLRIIVNGNEAAVHMQVHLVDGKGTVTESSVIELFTVAPDGRITGFRSFLESRPQASRTDIHR